MNFLCVCACEAAGGWRMKSDSNTAADAVILQRSNKTTLFTSYLYYIILAIQYSEVLICVKVFLMVFLMLQDML